ncbi:MAG: hypothetical protein EOM06_06155 [Sphingobacteriia bacterium]|nr:hypothetical protein [Sphingobacteriia bacterium]
MASELTIREIKQSEIPQLDKFLYDAIFIPDGEEKPEKDIIKLPELKVYVEHFGKQADICLVAEINGELQGQSGQGFFRKTGKDLVMLTQELPSYVCRFVKNTGSRESEQSC